MKSNQRRLNQNRRPSASDIGFEPEATRLGGQDLRKQAAEISPGEPESLQKEEEDFNKQIVALLDGAVKNAPAGSDIAITAVKSGIAAVNAAYDNMAKIAKQFTETAQSNFEFAASQAANEAKKAKKAA